ncbi:MAG: glycosyltransferase [Candidatus Woesearchaeota archaeon]
MVDEKRGKVKHSNADTLFEVSWEVCNKVGGINTVIKSKIPYMLQEFGENYYLIGPYFYDKVKGEFQEKVFPEECRNICDGLRELGIVPHYGKWLVEGKPNTILLDFQPLFARKDDIKARLWERYKIDSLDAGFEFDEPMVWSWAAGMLIEMFCRQYTRAKVVAIFHEWISGAGLLYLKYSGTRAGTVFVTHATVAGRSLADAGIDLYCPDEKGKRLLEVIDFDSKAYEQRVHSKHQLEKASAHNADVFTTVSDITGLEAEKILQKKPDIILPNGLNFDEFPTMDENSIRHKRYRDKIYHFLLQYFFPYYSLDIENTLIYFITSRYEIHDKGIDVFIRALGKLNQRMRAEATDKNIVAFFWVPSGVRGVKQEIVENKMKFKDIEDSLKDNAEHVMWHLLNTIVADKPITRSAIFTDRFINEIKNKVLKFKNDAPSPPLCTHDLADPNDRIMQMFRENNLLNDENDRVKVIFYPIYLGGADGLLDLTYYECMQGSHLGVFPSFYEPWGYTPLEAGALGVSSVTTDLAGFGRHILNQRKKDEGGVFILKRMGIHDDDVVDELSWILNNYATVSKKKRVDYNLEARRLALLADWDILAERYFKSSNIAINKVFGS